MSQSNMARHARRSAKEAHSAARHFKHVAESETNGMMHTIQKVGQEAVGAVKDGYGELRDAAIDYVDQGRSKATSLERSFERKVKSRPLASVLIGVGVGFLVGCFYARR